MLKKVKSQLLRCKRFYRQGQTSKCTHSIKDMGEVSQKGAVILGICLRIWPMRATKANPTCVKRRNSKKGIEVRAGLHFQDRLLV